MTEGEKQRQLCVVFEDINRNSSYSRFETPLEAEKIQQGLQSQGLYLIGIMTLPDATRRIKKQNLVSGTYPKDRWLY